MALTRRSPKRALFPAFLGVALGLVCTNARAADGARDPDGENAEQRAEARFRQASQAFDAGRVQEACAGFEESLHLFPTLGALLNVALCHEQQGRAATAWAEFTHAAAWANAGGQRDRAEYAHQHAVRLERALSRVHVEVAGDEAVELTVDGEPVVNYRQGLPLFLDAGLHVVVASAPGKTSHVASVVVPSSPTSEPIVLKIPLLQSQPEPTRQATLEPAPRVTRPNGRRTAGWIVAGAGAVSMGVGVYFGVQSLSSMSALGSTCTGGCDPSGARSSETLSLAALGVGLVGLGVGGWLVLSPQPSAPPQSARLSLVPQVSAHGQGLAVAGAW